MKVYDEIIHSTHLKFLVQHSPTATPGQIIDFVLGQKETNINDYAGYTYKPVTRTSSFVVFHRKEL